MSKKTTANNTKAATTNKSGVFGLKPKEKKVAPPKPEPVLAEPTEMLTISGVSFGMPELFKLTQEELFIFLRAVLPEAQEITGGLLYVPEAEDGVKRRPMLTCHMDIVGTVPPSEIYYAKNTYFISPMEKAKCLGADDRAGVMALLKVIFSPARSKYTYAFFRDEEIWCKGSGDFVKTDEFTNLLPSTSCFLSVDRRCEPNVPEIASYNHDSKDLKAHLKKYFKGYAFKRGSFTDCSVLSRASEPEIPCYNFTAGYKSEHSTRETLHMPTLLKVIDNIIAYEPEDKAYEVDAVVGYGWQAKGARGKNHWTNHKYSCYDPYEDYMIPGRYKTAGKPATKPGKPKNVNKPAGKTPGKTTAPVGVRKSSSFVQPTTNPKVKGPQPETTANEKEDIGYKLEQISDKVDCDICGEHGKLYYDVFTGSNLCQACARAEFEAAWEGVI